MKVENIVNEIFKCYSPLVVRNVVCIIEISSSDKVEIHLEQAIVGRVIRALQKCFHPDCFRCQLCHAALLEIGFSNNNGRFAWDFMY
jgi:hypothetical protein